MNNRYNTTNATKYRTKIQSNFAGKLMKVKNNSDTISGSAFCYLWEPVTYNYIRVVRPNELFIFIDLLAIRENSYDFITLIIRNKVFVAGIGLLNYADIFLDTNKTKCIRRMELFKGNYER